MLRFASVMENINFDLDTAKEYNNSHVLKVLESRSVYITNHKLNVLYENFPFAFLNQNKIKFDSINNCNPDIMLENNDEIFNMVMRLTQISSVFDVISKGITDDLQNTFDDVMDKIAKKCRRYRDRNTIFSRYFKDLAWAVEFGVTNDLLSLNEETWTHASIN